MAKIDAHYNKSGVSINYDAMTLEHILPQNPPNKAKDHDEYYGKIGNLLLIDEKTNNDLGNKPFSGKKTVLQKASIYVDDVLKNATDWTTSEIEQRTINFAKVAYNTVFKI